MKILGLESSAKAASVAICDETGLLGQYYQNSGLTHSRTLLPMVEALLKNLGLSIADMDIIAVAHGPGSFTGVRIGVSAVKGLAWAAEKPVCGVSTLEAMAYNGLTAPEGSIICCAMDARRQQFYNGLFEIKAGIPRRLCPDRAIGGEELALELKKLKKTIFVVGDGAKLCYNVLEKFQLDAILAPEPLLFQTAFGVCQAAKRAPTQSVHELLPLYLRLSQAERERQERVLKQS
ncbi:MAG: tRNA (adenosine(37)-N6)-threonylcarbamoyltransferase complex dimerization subunit type 1 TsaB [Oscillospiraceae bacterium]